MSDVFKVRNSTGKGKIASPTFWGIYILPLITNLKDFGLVCHIGDIYVASIISI